MPDSKPLVAVIMGSRSDLETLEQEGVFQLLQVHDSIVFEVDVRHKSKQRLNRQLGMIKGVMQNTPFLMPAMEVDIKLGRRHWGETSSREDAKWDGEAILPEWVRPANTWRNENTEYIWGTIE